MKKKLLLSICFLAFILPTHESVDGNLYWWCNQTSNPEPCKHHMISHDSASTNMSSRTQFRDMSIRAALDNALYLLNQSMSLDPISPTAQEKAAWTNCVHLYNYTISQLNKTLFYENRTPSDIQTWLSAARTSLLTCQNSILELNAKIILPLTSNNLTHLIHNALAINSVLSTEKEKNSSRWYTSMDDQTCLQQKCANVVVAQDGSGNFTTISKALDASLINTRNGGRFVIYVKKGIYNEYIEVSVHMTNITLIGESQLTTIISGSRSRASGYDTYNSATAKVCGDGFIGHEISFLNKAGADKGQAVALVSKSDHSAFYKCGFYGYQDTLWVMAQRQYYYECNIYGTVDFIFGNALVVLEKCNMYVRRPMEGGGTVITAQGRDIPEDNTGISIVNSRVMAARDLLPELDKHKVYLGRPWHPYSRTVYMETFLDTLVDPAGWTKWDDNQTTLTTLYFGEYRNYGPGSSTQRRVKWPGYQIITDKATADKFSVAKFIDGPSWLPKTGSPFFSALNTR